MNTQIINTQNDHTLTKPAMPLSNWAGWLSLALALAGLLLICMGDPDWLGLISCIIGTSAGFYALHHRQENHVGAHLGFNLGMLGLFLWVLLILLLPHVFKMDLTSLFEIPKYK